MILEGIRTGLTLLASGDPSVWGPIALSLRVSLTSTVMAAVVAVPAGVVLGLGRFPGKGLLRGLVQSLYALPTVLVGLIIYALLSRYGPLGDWELLYTPAAMIVGQVILALPIMIGLSAAAVEQADPRVAQTAYSLGASRARAIVLVASEGRAALLAAVAAGFGRVFAEIGVSMLLGGNIRGYTRNITTGIAFETGKGEFARGVALGVVLLLVALSVNLVLAWWQRGLEPT